jgi:RAD51-like protein 1
LFFVDTRFSFFVSLISSYSYTAQVMSSRRLDRVGLDPFVIECFSRNGVSTVGDLLLASPLSLMLYADLSLRDVRNLILKVSDKISCKPTSALDILHKRAQKKQFLSTGLNCLDVALKGGLLIGCISEISGPPGVGKTQFCLSCALQTIAQSHLSMLSGGLNSDGNPFTNNNIGSVVYIDTELKFDPNRLIQMAMETFPELYSSEYRTDAPHQVDRLLSCVKVVLSAITRHSLG